MNENTHIIFNVDASVLLVGTVVFFLALLAIIWKGRSEISDTIKESIGDFKDRFISIENKMEILWKDEIAPANSPRQLNDRGNDILNQSGIDKIIDDKRSKLIEILKSKKLKNPYDAEQAIYEITMELPKHCPDIVDKLKTGAFRTGTSIETVLFAGSIYLRNQIFPELGFSVNDLDKKDEKRN